ncbi:hypothetical protein V8G54_021777 [Vigna mungo]|uniref:ATP-dependent RNA helicase n=1 Tax=Vigna mungo TaxID=3915 RepID=A0AAQ3RXY9_VIGMU
MNGVLSSDGHDFFTSYDEFYESFDAMGLQENLLKGSYTYGFKKPSAIQQRGIVSFCKGLDIIQQAQSGTGKTATFCSGILEQLDYSLTQCQALVLALTLELAQQIERLCGHLEIILVLRFMLVWEVPVSVKTNAFYLAVFMSWLVPLVVCLVCFVGNHSNQITSRCLYWMRLMRYFFEVLRIKYMIYSSCCHLRFKWEFSQPQCLLRPLRSRGSS